MNPELKKPLLVGGFLFLLTLGWTYFLEQLAITPQSLLEGVGHAEELGFILTFPFAAFVLLFAATIGLITAYSDKDERSRVYKAILLSILFATTLAAIAFNHFAQWYPLALFFFGSIPLMIETARLKRLELKNFVVPRSAFSGAQRGLQIMGIGVLVTLAITALPQNDTLYKNFEDSFFSGKVVQQVNVEKLTTDFLISTQRNTLTQVLNTDSFQKLRTSSSPDDLEFVALMDQTLANVNSTGYRDQVNAQVKDQQKQINPQALVEQLQQTIPGYTTLKTNYWAIAAFLASLVFFMVALFILQPLAALFGTGIYALIPMDGAGSSTGMPASSSNGKGLWSSFTAQSPRVAKDNVTGWAAPPVEHPTDISADADAKTEPVVPEYAHEDAK